LIIRVFIDEEVELRNEDTLRRLTGAW